MILSKQVLIVVLPEPDSPTIPIDCPSSISNEIFSTAVILPNLVLYSIVRFFIIIFSNYLFVSFPFPLLFF